MQVLRRSVAIMSENETSSVMMVIEIIMTLVLILVSHLSVVIMCVNEMNSVISAQIMVNQDLPVRVSVSMRVLLRSVAMVSGSEMKRVTMATRVILILVRRHVRLSETQVLSVEFRHLIPMDLSLSRPLSRVLVPKCDEPLL